LGSRWSLPSNVVIGGENDRFFAPELFRTFLLKVVPFMTASLQ